MKEQPSQKSNKTWHNKDLLVAGRDMKEAQKHRTRRAAQQLEEHKPATKTGEDKDLPSCELVSLKGNQAFQAKRVLIQLETQHKREEQHLPFAPRTGLIGPWKRTYPCLASGNPTQKPTYMQPMTITNLTRGRIVAGVFGCVFMSCCRF